MKSRTKVVPVTIVPIGLLALSTFFFFVPLLQVNDAQHDPYDDRAIHIPPCDHVLLVSAPRHGSTWFLDSVEGCPSSKSQFEDYQKLITSSELWTSHEGPVHDLRPMDAAKYISNVCSVKLFPSLEQRGKDRVKELLQYVGQNRIPIFLLTRRPEGAYASLNHALESGKWAVHAPNRTSDHAFVWDEKFDRYRENLETYFRDIKVMLKEAGLAWDEFDYDNIRNSEVIFGTTNRCFIRNCNLK